MALSAEVFALFVAQVAVRALELILVVRRGVRVVGLDVFRLIHQSLRRMALRAGIDVGRIKLGGIALTVTHLAAHPLCDMAVSQKLISGRSLAHSHEAGAHYSQRHQSSTQHFLFLLNRGISLLFCRAHYELMRNLKP